MAAAGYNPCGSYRKVDRLLPRFAPRCTAPRFEGGLPDPTAVAEYGKRGRPDWARLELAIDGHDQIARAGHASGGKPSLRGALDALCELLRGASLGDAQRLSAVDVVEFYADFPERELPAALRAGALLESALAELREEHPTLGQAYLCTCVKVTAETIRQHIQRYNLKTVPEVRNSCGACSGCQSCWYDIEDLIAAHGAASGPSLSEQMAAIKSLMGRLPRLHPQARFVRVDGGDSLVVELPAEVPDAAAVRGELEAELEREHGHRYGITLRVAGAS